MQKNFHYNLTFALAVKAGFSQECAIQIAWANQFVDDCKDYDKYGIRTMVDIAFEAVACLIPEVQKNVFVPFHFLPGSKGSLIVKRNSEIIQRLIQAAITSNDRIWLGMVLHALQDSYSHENFSGVRSDENAKYKWNLTSMFAPRIGHAEYDIVPDMVGKKWYDQNELLVDNNEKFREAAFETYRILKTFASGECPTDIGFDIYNVIDGFLSIKNYDKGKEYLFESMGLNPKNKTSRYSDIKPDAYCIDRFVKAAKKQLAIVNQYLVNSI